MEQADTVVTHSTRYAVALCAPASRGEAPCVVARGMDRLADRIRELARLHLVPTVEDPILAEALYRHAQVGQPIPPEFAEAVARVLDYVEHLRTRLPARYLPLRQTPRAEPAAPEPALHSALKTP
jgi:flagellar biosynthetic protein FlhB